MDREGHFKLLKLPISSVNVFGEENVSEATKKICKIRLLQDFEKIAFFHFWPFLAIFGPFLGALLLFWGEFHAFGGQ